MIALGLTGVMLIGEAREEAVGAGAGLLVGSAVALLVDC